MNFRVALKAAIVTTIETEIPDLLGKVSTARFDPIAIAELPYVTVNSFEEPAEKQRDLHTYKLSPSFIVTVYCEGETSEDDADALAALIEDALCHPQAPFMTSTTAICKQFDLVMTKIRKQDKTERDITFCSMMFQAEGYREITD